MEYVGNIEMPKWSEDNKESVEAHAIELRHKLAQRLGHRVQHPTAAEHVRYEAPPPAKDPEADKLVYPEETLTPDERASNVREVGVTRLGGLFAEIDNISKKGVTMDMEVEDTDEEAEAEPMEVEDDAVYAQKYEDDMQISGPDKVESAKLATALRESIKIYAT